MKERFLFSPSELGIANTLNAMIYANPFRAKRHELDATFFDLVDTKDFDFDVEPVVDALSRNTYIQSYVHVAEILLNKALLRYRNASSKGLPASQFAAYEHLVYFYLFHWSLPMIDEYIRECLEYPSQNPKWITFRELEDKYRLYFEPLSASFSPAYPIEDFASFCFQFRRAFFHTFNTLKGNSSVLNELRARVWDSIFTHDMRRYIRSLYDRMSDIYTLICGPSGSGKEVVARCIGLSRYIPFDSRALKFERNFTESFHAINLSALSSTLIESELFGHKKGAFTGALADKIGYFESSGTFGTVFMDEIGDTDPLVQVKLLRVLQTRQFQRLGDTQALPFRGKVMAATNVDLLEAIEAGNFREDFYYRLCADQIRTPSLREILDDSPDEIEFLLGYICRKFVGVEEGEGLKKECLLWIRKNMPANYEWHGNFRELEQCVRNVMVHGEYVPHHRKVRKRTSLSESEVEILVSIS